MKIRYMHIANPGIEKVHDSEKSLQGCISLIHALGSDRTQEEWDRNDLKCFEKDLKAGIVLYYSVVEEGAR